jgi:hypothetical protein
MWSAALLLPLLPLAFADDFRILHRIHNPLGAAPLPFFERGKLSFTPGSGSSLVASDSLGDDLLQFAETAQSLKGALYQVALEREGDEHEGQWSVSSVKAVCPVVHSSFCRISDVSMIKVPFTQEHVRNLYHPSNQ